MFDRRKEFEAALRAEGFDSDHYFQGAYADRYDDDFIQCRFEGWNLKCESLSAKPAPVEADIRKELEQAIDELLTAQDVVTRQSQLPSESALECARKDRTTSIARLIDLFARTSPPPTQFSEPCGHAKFIKGCPRCDSVIAYFAPQGQRNEGSLAGKPTPELAVADEGRVSIPIQDLQVMKALIDIAAKTIIPEGWKGDGYKRMMRAIELAIATTENDLADKGI